MPDVGSLTIIGVFSVGLAGVLAGIITSWFKNWRKVRESEHLNALKQTMVERGMSAEEIERVINAGRPARAPAPPEDGIMAARGPGHG